MGKIGRERERERGPQCQPYPRLGLWKALPESSPREGTEPGENGGRRRCSREGTAGRDVEVRE